MERVLCIIIGYLFGLIQSGYLYGRTKHMDIRQHGSGNAGSTNVLRVMGIKAAAIVYLGDFFKAVAAMTIARLLFADSAAGTDLLAMYAGLGVTLGHNYPFYLGFKGGKGIASMSGIFTAMDIRIALVCLVIFSTTVALTRYVSLGSILISITFCVMLVFFGNQGCYNVAPGCRMELYALVIILMGMAIWRHRANIKRLLSGTENKVGAKKA